MLKILLYGRLHVFNRKSRLHEAKLEEWPTYVILVHLWASSFFATGIGSLVKLGVDWVIQQEHDFPRLHDVAGFVIRATLISALALLFLLFLTFSVRLLKVLGERWFP
jgi:hypothetical protein